MPSLTVGIEEEYLLVDRESRDLVQEPPDTMMAECEEMLSSQVTPEFLRAQIEVGTRVCKTAKEARRDLRRLRSSIAEVADKYGYAPIAASTHPFGHWEEQKQTPKERYDMLAENMQAVARRLLICGTHVHVAIEDPDLRIDLMNQVAYFLPHLLALSTSSPFWRGENTGLMSYRLTVFDGLPRTGLPDRFTSFAEYERLVGQMVKAGCIEDATRLWWDIRPSARYPTLEMRMTDICTRLYDNVTIAAFFQSLLRALLRLRQNNQRWRIYPPSLVMENRWLAQRHGVTGRLVDFGKAEMVPFADLLEELLEFVRADAMALDCLSEVNDARDIVARGTSAQRQIAVHDAAVAEGAGKREALEAVVDFLIAETVHGLDQPDDDDDIDDE